MKHLELHIIQSVPVACLNRDDLNSPKTAVFGGVQRARVSSQSWKRAIRELAKEIAAENNMDMFNGNRTRRMVYALATRLVERGIPERSAKFISERIADTVETLDSKDDSMGYKKIKTVMFFSELEYDAVADLVALSEEVVESGAALEKAINDEDENGKDAALRHMAKVLSKGEIAKAVKSVQLKDAADIALFGRMVANDHSLKVDGASLFAHALSTHKVDNEIDFFAAVDDFGKDDPGAAITNTLEFNSATYYRFAALNLDELANDEHLGDIVKGDVVERSVENRKQVVRTFLKATIHAIPSARKTTMNGNTIPLYVLGIVREKGHPIQLINAFERPIRPTLNGFAVESINRLNLECVDLKDTWGIESLFTKAVLKNTLKDDVALTREDEAGNVLWTIETCSFNELIEGMVEHVH